MTESCAVAMLSKGMAFEHLTQMRIWKAEKQRI